MPALRAVDAIAGVVVVAHRGASKHCPENTLVAFRRAVAAGAPVVEFDVYQTRDGVWVCVHDATVDRTTDGVNVFGREGVRIDELTFAEVQRLDAGSWFGPQFAGEPIPTLEQALAAIGPALPMIERKGGDPEQLVRELQRLDVVDDVLVQAFDWDWLERVHRAEPRLLIAALGSKELTTERLADLDRTGAQVVHWHHRHVGEPEAAMVRATGRGLCVYTVDDEAEFARCVRVGCRYVTTNLPAHFLERRAAGAFGSQR